MIRFILLLTICFQIYISAQEEQTKVAQSQKTLKYGEFTKLFVIDPGKATSSAEKRLAHLLFTPILTQVRPGKFEQVLGNIEAVKINKRNAIKFTLNRNIHWNNGASFESSDIIDTLTKLIDSQNKNKELSLSHVFPLFPNSIDLNQGTKYFSVFNNSDIARNTEKLKELFCGVHIQPRTILNLQIPELRENVKTFSPSCGPFSLEKVGTRRIFLAKNTYFRKERTVDNIELVTDVVTGSFPGEVDILPEVAPSKIKAYLGGKFEKFETHTYNSLSFFYFGFNWRSKNSQQIKKPKFINFMKSLIYSSDTQNEINTKTFLKLGRLLTGPFDEQLVDKNNNISQIQPIKQNKQTLRLIYEAGGAYSEELKSLCSILKNKAGQYGVTIKLEGCTPHDWEKKAKGNEYDIILTRFSYKKDYDLTEFAHAHGRENYIGFDGKKLNYIKDEGQKFDDNLLKAKKTSVKARRKAVLQNIYQFLHNNYTGIFIFNPKILSIIDKENVDLNGYDVHPQYFFNSAHKWILK